MPCSTSSTDRRQSGGQRANIETLPADERDAEIERLRAENAKLQQQLDMDDNTPVRSRAAYQRDNPSAKGVAFIDLIAFKGYNTKFNETGGDVILREFGQVLVDVAGAAAYRRGGDEFAILSDRSPEHAAELAAAAQEAMAKVRIELQGKDGSRYELQGIPFRTGVGVNDEQAVADSASRKQAGDREVNANVRRLGQPGPEERAVSGAQRDAAGRDGSSPPGAVESAPTPANEAPADAGVSASGAKTAEGIARALAKAEPDGDVSALREKARKAIANQMGEAAAREISRPTGFLQGDPLTQAIHDGQYEAIRELGASLPTPVRESDIPMSMAVQAYAGTSHSPERRGASAQRNYVRTMVDAWKRGQRAAGNDTEAQARVADEFAGLVSGYLQRTRAALGAHSRVMSTMIAGPAR